VVSKDEILEAVWHGRAVAEVTLNSRINAARVAIGDTGTPKMLIRTVPRRGFRFVADASQDDPGSAAPASAGSPQHQPTFRMPRQEVSFCTSSDGVRLAVASSGAGPPVVKVGTWLTHIQHDWQSPLWSPLFTRLVERHRLIRYDPRGCGLSDRHVPDISFEGFVHDLETVADALSLERFALFGVSQGAALAVAYAARYPARVSRLVLSGGFALGWRRRGNADEIATREAMITLLQHGWGQDNPAFRQVFTSRLWPEASLEQLRACDELQRLSASAETAIRVFRAVGDIDVTGLLASVAAPCLVLHSRWDAVQPLELGLMLAREIPGARFIEVDSKSHLPLSHEAAWPAYLDEICGFLGQKDANE
jgi:pimeloyl-ACP methyl ester carboxylesterase